MFVVLGASGNTGKVVAETSAPFAREGGPRRPARRSQRADVEEAGAEVSMGDVEEDGAALERAFSGAEGVYVLLPPNFSSSQVRADNSRRASTIATAIEAADVPHVVLLSSGGAQQTQGTGPVLGLRDAGRFSSRGHAAVTAVRAAYFMENWGSALPAVAQGVLPTFLLAGQGDPLVATRDVPASPLRACSLMAGTANGSSSLRARVNILRGTLRPPWRAFSESRPTCSRHRKRRSCPLSRARA